jgi:hypothetical protein
MIFDCVLVNTGLRFHWICNREERGGGICKLMIISILNHFSLLRLLIVFDWWKHINIDVTLPFWVIMRSGRRNVMNHIASRGTIFGRSFVVVRGFFLSWVILQRERHHDHIWIFEHSNCLWGQFRDGVMSLYGKWVCLWHYMGTPQRCGFLGCIKLITLYYSSLFISPLIV